MTVIKEGYENIIVNEENNTIGRAIMETVGESAVAIREGIVIGAIVGLAGAPAIVTGAATVFVVWGLDKLSEHFTGKNVGELVSDAAIDAGEWVVDKVGEGISAIGDGINAAGKAISGWWNRIKGSGRASYAGGGIW